MESFAAISTPTLTVCIPTLSLLYTIQRHTTAMTTNESFGKKHG
jgi:hypothetical protein